jgi:hypothetical protein
MSFQNLVNHVLEEVAVDGSDGILLLLLPLVLCCGSSFGAAGSYLPMATIENEKIIMWTRKKWGFLRRRISD